MTGIVKSWTKVNAGSVVALRTHKMSRVTVLLASEILPGTNVPIFYGVDFLNAEQKVPHKRQSYSKGVTVTVKINFDTIEIRHVGPLPEILWDILSFGYVRSI